MHVFSGTHLYLISQHTIRDLGLEDEQLLLDAGKIDQETFIAEFENRLAMNKKYTPWIQTNG